MTRSFASFLAAGVALTALTVSASAADLPRRQAVAAVAPVMAYNWTGLYLGANAGYGFGGQVDTNVIGGDFDIDGGVVGGQIGYNWQFNQFVVGLETDLQWAQIDGRNTVVGYKGGMRWFGTVRGRVGYAWDRFMIYGTGGFAYGEGRVRDLVAPFGRETNTHVGWTVGGGVEAAVWQNWSVKAEYLYVNLGSENYPVGLGVAGGKAQLDSHIVRLGVNYKF